MNKEEEEKREEAGGGRVEVSIREEGTGWRFLQLTLSVVFDFHRFLLLYL